MSRRLSEGRFRLDRVAFTGCAVLLLAGGPAALGQDHGPGCHGPYGYPLFFSPYVSPGSTMASGWEALGDGVAESTDAEHARDKKVDAKPVKKTAPSKFDVRFVPRGWVVAWDRLVPLTDLSRNGSLYVLHPVGDGRVRITLDGRELFAEVRYAAKYEEARTLLEGS